MRCRRRPKSSTVLRHRLWGAGVKLIAVSVENFRSFSSFSLQVDGDSLSFVSPNGVGKTTLFQAVLRGLGQEAAIAAEDFLDPARAIEIRLKLNDLSSTQQAALTGAVSYAGGLHIEVGVQAVWNPAAQAVERVHGFPKADNTWRASRPEERDALRVISLAAWRDPRKLLSLEQSQSLLAELMADLPLGPDLARATSAISAAGKDLGSAVPLARLFSNATAHLDALMPESAAAPFSLDHRTISHRDLLAALTLLLEYGGGSRIPVSAQSGGLRQLSILTFALELLAQTPGAILLIDEPEVALHPQVQRALMTNLRKRANQVLIATHSASILSRALPTTVVRLSRVPPSTVEARRPTLSACEAQTLARYATPNTAEAYFARAVILVEGEGDRLALSHLAGLLGRDLDAEGISLIAMGGKTLFRHFLKLLGPRGLGIRLAAMCDADAEAKWAAALRAEGVVTATSRHDLEAAGVFVCDPDLEAEFVTLLGEATVEALITSLGDEDAFAQFSDHPKRADAPKAELLRKFVHKTDYAIPLVDTAGARAPRPLLEVLDCVKP